MVFKKIILKVLFVFFLLLNVSAFAEVFYLPHIHATSDAWETYLIADPVLYGPAYYELTLYDDNGNVVSTQTGTIPTNQELRISLRQLGGTSGIFVTKSYPVRVRLGYIAKESLGGGTAEFPLPSKLSRQAVFTLSNYYDQLNWSGFAILNGSDNNLSVTARGYKDGTQVVSKDFTMNAHTKVVDFFDTFLGLNSFNEVDTVVFTTDYPALTGIVISGKDNDKLLFSPSQNTVPDQTIFNEEYYNSLYQTGMAIANNSYYTFFYHDGHYYLRKIYGDTFGMYELSGDLFAHDIIASSDGENLILLGRNNNGKFAVRKVSPTGTTIWETEIGSYNTSWLAEFDENNIVGQAYNGSVVVAFHDHSLDKGVVKVLDDNDGTVAVTNDDWTTTARYYKAFVYSGTVGFAFKYVSGGKYRMQIAFYNSSGSLVKQIFDVSPINGDVDNILFDAIGSGDYIYCVFGVKVNDGSVIELNNYSLYAMAVPYADTNFSNAMIIPLPNTFLPKGSRVFSNFTLAFDSNSDTTWVIFTSPFYWGFQSKKILLRIKDNLPTSIFSSIYMPYKVTGMVDVWGLFLITGQQAEYIDTSTIRTKYIEKTLIGNNILNY